MTGILFGVLAGLLVGAIVAYPRGQRHPDRETKESLRDEGVLMALSELTERPWTCAEEIAAGSIRLTRDRGYTSIVVRSGGARSPKVGDQVRLEMGSPTPHHSIAVYHMKWGEILKPVKLEPTPRRRDVRPGEHKFGGVVTSN